MIIVKDFSTGRLINVRHVHLNEDGDIVSKADINNKFLQTYPFLRRSKYADGYTVLRLIKGYELVKEECSRVSTRPKKEATPKAEPQEVPSWQKAQEAIAKIEQELVENEIIPRIQSLVEPFTQNRRTPFSISVSYDTEMGLNVDIIENKDTSVKQEKKPVPAPAPTIPSAPIAVQKPNTPSKPQPTPKPSATVISKPKEMPEVEGATSLYVRFPNGRIFDDPIAITNYANIIKYIGSEKVRALWISRISRNIISYENEIPKNILWKYKPLDKGFYLHANLSNADKFKILQEISKRLSLNLRVELRPNDATQPQASSSNAKPVMSSEVSRNSATAQELSLFSQMEQTDTPNLSYKTTQQLQSYNLVVSFPNGKVFNDAVSENNYIKVIKHIGLAKVRALGINRCNRNIVSYLSEIPSEVMYKYKNASGGYYVYVNSTVEVKYKILQEIKERLSLDFQIDLKLKATSSKQASVAKLKPNADIWEDKVAEQPNAKSDPRNIIRQRAVNRLERHYGRQLYAKNLTTYLTTDGRIGYIVLYSREYLEKGLRTFWFGYKRRPELNKCKEKYIAFICGDENGLLVFSLAEIEAFLAFFYQSLDADGKIDHWHIWLHILPTGKAELLLPYANTRLLDVTDYLLSDE